MSARTVWVVSPFSQPASPATFDRYAYVCQALTERGARVTQFVSGFDHAHKARRRVPSVPWRTVRVPEPGYARNVSVARVLSHVVFDLAIGPLLVAEALRGGPPDVLLAALPHNGAASVAGLLCKATRTRFLVDVHDTWPESVLGVARLGRMGMLAFRAWKAAADLAYALADDAFAESRRYAERADAVRLARGLSPARAIYLGGDGAYYAAIPPAPSLPAELSGASFRVGYAGTLGENYDLETALDAVAALGRRVPGVALLLLGAGERERALRDRASQLGLQTWFSGRIAHAELVSLLKTCHVALNCFRPDGNVAYSYKLNDYLLSGVPVVNALEGEAAELIDEHRLGANYRAGSGDSMLAALTASRERWREEPEWGRRIAGFAAEHLDRAKIYAPLLERCLGG